MDQLKGGIRDACARIKPDVLQLVLQLPTVFSKITCCTGM